MTGYVSMSVAVIGLAMATHGSTFISSIGILVIILWAISMFLWFSHAKRVEDLLTKLSDKQDESQTDVEA